MKTYDELREEYNKLKIVDDYMRYRQNESMADAYSRVIKMCQLANAMCELVMNNKI